MELKEFQEKQDWINEQQEEEMQQPRETWNEKKHKILIDKQQQKYWLIT